MRVRLGLRLFLGVFLIVGIAAFFVMRVFVDEVKPGVRQAMESSLVDTAAVLAQLAADDLQAGRIADGGFARAVDAAGRRHLGANVWNFRKDHLDYRIYVTDARGVVVYDSAGSDLGKDYSQWNDVYRTLRGRYGARSSRDESGHDTVMHVAAPIVDDAGRIIGVLGVANPNRTTQPFIAASQQEILRKGGILLLLATLIGLAMTVWLSVGIGRLNAYAKAVGAGERVPPPPSRRDEIGDLGRVLEVMRKKLDGKEYVERYVQSLTHEMKGPLAAIRGAAELLQEPLPPPDRARFARNVETESARLNQMIDKLLALAAVEQRGWLQDAEPVAVGALLDDVAGQVRVTAHARGVEVVVAPVAAETEVPGDPFLLRQAVHNMVDNAIAFSAAGGCVEISARDDGSALVIEVADRGPGIPDYASERVFERFYSLPRPDTGVRSSGLGLPFVAEVATLHRGGVSLRNRDGGGAVAELSIASA